MSNRVVLLGAGHAHLEVLRRFARRPVTGTDLTLVTPQALTPYTGMIPGLIAGRFQTGDAFIDAHKLAQAAKAETYLTHGTKIDVRNRSVTCADGKVLNYDYLSINIGARTVPPFDIDPAGPRVLGVKPVEQLLQTLRDVFEQTKTPRITLAGGGAGGIEIAAALSARGAAVTLVTGATGLLPRAPKKARKRILKRLRKAQVTVHEKKSLIGTEPENADKDGLALLSDGSSVATDLIILATGVAAPALFDEIDLPKSPDGFLKVNTFLQSAADTRIFAAGDCISFPVFQDDRPLPRAGVYAVRQGPVLAHNLHATLTGKKMRNYTAQENHLAILSLHPNNAVGIKGKRVFAGPLIANLKDAIDRRFIARYRAAE